MKKRTATPASSEMAIVMTSPASVSITFRPTVHPPRKTNTVIRPAAVTFLRTFAPTAGPTRCPWRIPRC